MAAGAESWLQLSDVTAVLGLRDDTDAAVRRATIAALARLPLDAAAADAAGVPETSAAPVVPDIGGSEVEPESAADAEATAPDALEFVLRGEPVLLSPALVTALIRLLVAMERPDRVRRLLRFVCHRIAESPGGFRPDLAGLAAEHRLLLSAIGPPDRQVDSVLGETTSGTQFRRDIAWIVSRAGPRAVLAELDDSFRSIDADDRLAAACLLAEVASMFRLPEEYLDPVMVSDRPDTSRRRPPARLDGPPLRPVDDDVRFTVYRPGTVRPEQWYDLLAFVHRTEPFTDRNGLLIDPIATVERQAAGRLGPQIQQFAALGSDSSAGLPRGDEIVFEPWLEAGDVNPPRAALRWEEPVHEADFRIRFPRNVSGRRVRGGLRVHLGVLLIGRVDFVVRVRAGGVDDHGDARPVSARPYRRIFASYSHLDTEIVYRIADVVSVTGDRYLIDARELRAGERWEQALADMITGADMFQLFWSHNSMASAFVRREWEHALDLRREGFVRPVYWQSPLPEDKEAGLPPAALRDLHFCKLVADIGGTAAGTTCWRCGRPLPDGARFCGHCGVGVHGSQTPLAGRSPGRDLPMPAPPAGNPTRRSDPRQPSRRGGPQPGPYRSPRTVNGSPPRRADARYGRGAPGRSNRRPAARIALITALVAAIVLVIVLAAILIR